MQSSAEATENGSDFVARHGSATNRRFAPTQSVRMRRACPSFANVARGNGKKKKNEA
jgi:hypothetical protein